MIQILHWEILQWPTDLICLFCVIFILESMKIFLIQVLFAHIITFLKIYSMACNSLWVLTEIQLLSGKEEGDRGTTSIECLYARHRARLLRWSHLILTSPSQSGMITLFLHRRTMPNFWGHIKTVLTKIYKKSKSLKNIPTYEKNVFDKIMIVLNLKKSQVMI